MRKYELNEKFFETWSNDMAYVFGYIAADGCLCLTSGKYSLEMYTKESDKLLLENIKDIFEYGGYVYYVKPSYYKRDDYWRNPGWRLDLNSKKLCEDIQKLGMEPNKSLTMEWHDSVPEEYLSDYVRGFFDGDGSVYYIKHPSNKTQKIGINFTGTLDYLRKLREVINNVLGRDYGYIRTLVIKAGYYYQLVYSGNVTVKIILDWIYKNSNEKTRLLRKYNIYSNFYADPDVLLSKQHDVINVSEEKSDTYVFSVFDKEMTITEMANDSRCVVSRSQLYHRIIKMELDPEFAMITPKEDLPDQETPTIENGIIPNHSKLSWELATKIREKKAAGVRAEELSKKYGMEISSIYDLLRNKTWYDPNYVPDKSNNSEIICLEYNGRQVTIRELADMTGVPYSTIDRRIREGKSVEQAISRDRLHKGSKALSDRDIKAWKLAGEIRESYKNGLRGKAILEKHGVTKSRYMDIILNRTLKEDKEWWKE